MESGEGRHVEEVIDQVLSDTLRSNTLEYT